MKDLAHCPLVLAVELDPSSLARPASTLPLESASALVDEIAVDLAKLVPGIERMGLALAGALFDPAQVLRPGWPIFAELAGLYTREARGRGFAPQLIGFGCSAGRMAHPALEPDAALAGGFLLAVPLVLIGPAELADEIGARLEAVLEDAGLAGPGTALFLNQSLSLKVAHARYLTHHDLAALTAIQLEHAGLAATWPLIECALLTPAQTEIVRPAPGVAFVYTGGTLGVRAATQGYVDFVRDAGAGAGADRADAYCAARLVERRMLALLAAHGLPARVVALSSVPADDAALLAALDAADACAGDGFVETLAAHADGAPTRLFAHVHPALGVVALSAAARASDAAPWRALAHAYPRDRAGYDTWRQAFAERYGCDPTPQRLEGLALSADGREVLA